MMVVIFEDQMDFIQQLSMWYIKWSYIFLGPEIMFHQPRIGGKALAWDVVFCTQNSVHGDDEFIKKYMAWD